MFRKEYYYNKVTGQSQWTMPEDVSKSKSSIGTSNANYNAASYMHYQSQPSKNYTGNQAPSITFSGRKLINKASRTSSNTNSVSNVDELNKVIANMTHEKNILLEELNGTNSNITCMMSTISILQSNITMLLAGIDELEDQLVSNNEKLESEIKQNNLLLKKLNVTQNLYLQLCENYDELEKNRTEIAVSLSSSNKELTAAYEEIEKLEDDLRQVSMPTMKKMKTHTNLFSRMWGYALTIMNSNNDYSLIEKQESKIQELSSLIDVLRENITAMTDALLSKEDLIIELSDQLDENEEESNHRRKAYAELKTGILQLQEENIELQDGIDDRDHAMVDMAATIVQLNTTLYEKDEIYSAKLQSLHSRINEIVSDGNRDSASQLSLISQISQQLIEKDNMIEYLTGDIELLRSLSVGYQSELEELKQKHYNLTVSYDRLVTSSSSNTTASDEPSLTVLNADRLSYPDNSSSDDHNSDDNNSDDSKDRIFRLFDV
jgi:chromosome segregation ATPase